MKIFCILLLNIFISSASAAVSSVLQLNPSTSIKIGLHKENYIYPAVKMSSRALGAKKETESRFQYSIKLSLIGKDYHSFNFAYTQKSYWQLYDAEDSRAFRENTYNPELFYRLGNNSFYMDLGIAHMSNGKSEPASRGINYGYLSFSGQSSYFKLKLTGWLIQSEDYYGSSDFPEKPHKVADTYGYGEGELAFRIGSTIFKTTGRLNASTNKGLVETKILFHLYKFSFLSLMYSNGYYDSMRSNEECIEVFGIGIVVNP